MIQVDLLGYLLEALESSENQRVEEVLQSNAEAQRQFDLLKQWLISLGADDRDIEVPQELAYRTCCRVHRLASS